MERSGLYFSPGLGSRRLMISRWWETSSGVRPIWRPISGYWWLWSCFMWSRTITSVGEPSSPRCLSCRRRHSVRSRAATPAGSSACTTQSALSTSSSG